MARGGARTGRSLHVRLGGGDLQGGDLKAVGGRRQENSGEDRAIDKALLVRRSTLIRSRSGVARSDEYAQKMVHVADRVAPARL